MGRVVKKEGNFYRRDPRQALRGMMSLTPEECGVYNVLLDLMYDSWRPLPFHSEDERRWVLRWVNAAPQRVNPIIRRLIDKGRIVTVDIDGRSYLTDEAFERERAEVKAPKSPGKVDQKSGEVGKNSGEVAEKSPVLDPKSDKKQRVTRPEKSQNKTQSKKKEKEEKEKPLWVGDPDVRQRIVEDPHFGAAWCRSYLDRCSIELIGGVAKPVLRAQYRGAVAILEACPHLSVYAVLPP